MQLSECDSDYVTITIYCISVLFSQFYSIFMILYKWQTLQKVFMGSKVFLYDKIVRFIFASLFILLFEKNSSISLSLGYFMPCFALVSLRSATNNV